MPREILSTPSEFTPVRTLAAMREMARLSGRLQAMGIPVAELESSTGLPALWLDRGVLNRPAAVLSTELDPDAFEEALDVVCRLAAGRPLSLLPYGAPLPHPERLHLRDGDVALPIYEPLDPSALRFQVNRAIAPIAAPDRGAHRAPIELEVLLKIGMRSRMSRVYTLSSRGAFLLLDRPLRPGRRVYLEVPVGGANHPRASGRVMFVNRVNAPAYPDLPAGVALRFDRVDAIAACAIDHLVERRLSALEIQG
ncbi:MAG: PilZ domain-containing protein [Deltaproteobacteria bacterium]|nr:PilZ domain-containing protein [Deltaproteobacteria bacterium]MBW2397935.1 PilZ domain-containing protein [Deltaproteobacteria bacterium]MBW2667707.1 PilZ domain-containing protein [Deltaproteobacteria bacterium]